jgi:hypothetical protein
MRGKMLRSSIGILILPLFYFVAYVALLKHSWWTPTPFPNTPRPWIYDRPTEYHLGGRAATVIFWPANRIDRLIRPSAWRIDLAQPQADEPDA